jgi:hypothetical protein
MIQMQFQPAPRRVRLLDGITVQDKLGAERAIVPGEYGLREQGDDVSLFASGRDELPVARMSARRFGAMLAWRQVVYLSW